MSMFPLCSFIRSLKIRLLRAFRSWENIFWECALISLVRPGNMDSLNLALLDFRNCALPKCVGSASLSTFHMGSRACMASSMPLAPVPSPSVVAYLTKIPSLVSWSPMFSPWHAVTGRRIGQCWLCSQGGLQDSWHHILFPSAKHQSSTACSEVCVLLSTT